MPEDKAEDPIENIRQEITKKTPSDSRRAIEAFTLAALGSIPWVGGFISAIASLKLDKDEIEKDDLQTQWLEEHTEKIEALKLTLEYISDRFSRLGNDVYSRIQSDEYLQLVRKGFRIWDKSDTVEKQKYIADLLSNASATKLSSDDVVRLFLDWLDSYHEIHFSVIGEIYRNPGITRYGIWQSVYGELPREDSSGADLFKMLIRDLSMGGVIRQSRATTVDGQFLKKTRSSSKARSRTMESAFEGTKPYVLTELGKQFVHYTMTDIVSQLDNPK